ncbi:hypothetical protein B0H17DRAFT_1084632 [Mycena rosella]|uniref:Uncharacterized protein n=1 Tax=Mycena rosella TaxID=1033263 RepID=A0AAD7D3L1_MYCRO|nr:hypothetical protein B0H17DRAFT_1084632 [Mycena rosella]
MKRIVCAFCFGVCRRGWTLNSSCRSSTVESTSTDPPAMISVKSAGGTRMQAVVTSSAAHVHPLNQGGQEQ